MWCKCVNVVFVWMGEVIKDRERKHLSLRAVQFPTCKITRLLDVCYDIWDFESWIACKASSGERIQICFAMLAWKQHRKWVSGTFDQAGLAISNINMHLFANLGAPQCCPLS